MRPKIFTFSTSSLILGGCSLALLGHLFILQRSELDWMRSPISALSEDGHAVIHALVLFAFAASQALVAIKVNYSGAGYLTRCIQILAILNALLIVSLGYVNTLNNTQLHITFLSVIASITGIMMSCLLARDVASNNFGFASVVNGVLLIVWLALIPVFLLVNADFMGAYQRSVAAVYVFWLGIIALRPEHCRQSQR